MAMVLKPGYDTYIATITMTARVPLHAKAERICEDDIRFIVENATFSCGAVN